MKCVEYVGASCRNVCHISNIVLYSYKLRSHDVVTRRLTFTLHPIKLECSFKCCLCLQIDTPQLRCIWTQWYVPVHEFDYADHTKENTPSVSMKLRGCSISQWHCIVTYPLVTFWAHKSRASFAVICSCLPTTSTSEICAKSKK